ncbi:MAG: hypothetical protein ISR58_11180 [Anaerolineales bacterium]|nr:hypothetical protein [Chloroflexota bacterium]MBL6981737.1 hypothetical protein [Anaerolineales bacterium]
MKNRLLIPIIVFILILCLALTIVGIASVVRFINQNPLGELEPPRETATLPSLSSPVKATDEGTVDPEIPQANTIPEASPDAINPGIMSQMETIQEQIIHMRGLDPQGEFSREIQSTEELRQDLVEAFDEEMNEYESWEYTLTLSIFGLLDESFDIYSFHVDLLTEQIAGYYDQETKEMVLVAGGEFGGPERMTYAHEYIHALQDQNFDIKEGLDYNDESCEENSERCAAIEALLEGDASLSEAQWFMHYATEQDYEDLMAFYGDMEMPVMDQAPAFLGQDLLFPYQYGYDFVQYLFDRGGWETVNQAYQNAPVSTEQILHPERYPEDIPSLVNIPDLLPILGDGWELIDQDVIGEWYTYLILGFGLDENARLDRSNAAQAADGWEGDVYAVYYQEQSENAVMIYKALWQSDAEAKDFATAFREYATGRFGNPIDEQELILWQAVDGFHAFYQENSFTTWIFASEQTLVEGIWKTLK